MLRDFAELSPVVEQPGGLKSGFMQRRTTLSAARKAMTSLQESRSQTKPLSPSSVGNRGKEVDGGCPPPAPASPGTQCVLFRNPPTGWHCFRELSPFNTQGQAVPHCGAHPVQKKERETLVQLTRVYSKLQASANLRGPICNIDQLHTEGSLKSFLMLNLVN